MAENSAIEWTEAEKEHARSRVNVEVRFGRIPRPNSLPCVDCGHVWKPGERRHEYDHHKGYAPENILDVQAVCTLCHAQRNNPAAAKTACKRGHPFTPENTGRKQNGTRICLECRRASDRERGRDAQFWREYRARRRKSGAPANG